MSKTTEPLLEIHSGLILKGELSMAKDVLLTGKFEGELRTEGCLTVAEGAVATGTIEAGALVLEPGNKVEARVKVGGYRPPQASDAVRKAGANKWSSGFRKLKQLVLGRK